MQFKNLALLSLATGVLAMPEPAEKRQDNAVPAIPSSILGVLVTALPASLLAIAASDTNAVSSLIADEFGRGHTPEWFSALPTDVQGFLRGGATGSAAPGPSATDASLTLQTSGLSSAASGLSSAISSAASEISGAISDATTGVPNPSDTSSIASRASSALSSARSVVSSRVSEATETSTGGASLPTGVVGAGAAAAIGLLGVLAL